MPRRSRERPWEGLVRYRIEIEARSEDVPIIPISVVTSGCEYKAVAMATGRFRRLLPRQHTWGVAVAVIDTDVGTDEIRGDEICDYFEVA